MLRSDGEVLSFRTGRSGERPTMTLTRVGERYCKHVPFTTAVPKQFRQSLFRSVPANGPRQYFSVRPGGSFIQRGTSEIGKG
jgi:hypothetical protein